MKNSIDMARLRKEAKAANVSIYILIKRELGFRKTNFKDLGLSCFNCKHSQVCKFQDGVEKVVCSWVGEMNDVNAFVYSNYICRKYKKSYQKNLSKELENG